MRTAMSPYVFKIRPAMAWRLAATKTVLLLSIVYLGLAMVAFAGAVVSPHHPDVRDIVARSVAANDADWAAAPAYDFTEQNHNPTGSKTFQVMMILGSPYYRLVAINDKALTAPESAQEQQRLERTIARRRAESPQDTAKRVEAYRSDRRRDHLLLGQLTRAFDFTFEREETLGPYSVYVLKATRRKGYRPPNTETQVLTGMEGELWIDKETFQWVKVEAHVVHPVSIKGFLARVEPPTFFELEKAPVGDGPWLPSHFVMRAHAKVLLAFKHNTQEEETYSNYHRSSPALVDVTPAQPVR
jgi:hypothetical protein